jgi:PAS domain-containing protein
MTGQGDEPRQRRTLRLTCSLTADFRIRAPNRAMCEVLGYTYAELDGAPSWALLRPHDIPLASEPDAHPKLIAVRNGEIAAETYTSWMESKDGKRIDFDATWTWNPINLEWDIVMEVEDTQAVYVEYDIDPETLETYIARIPERMREQQHRIQERVRQAALQAEDADAGALSADARERNRKYSNTSHQHR